METTQSWQPRLTRVGIAALAAVFIVFMYIAFLAGRFKGISNTIAMDYAQLARNIAQGEGYTTKSIRPLSLAVRPQIHGHPELSLAPVHPYIASLFMRVMPQKDRALALSCGLGFLLTVPVVFFLGWQLFDVRTGVLAVALFVTNIAYLRYSISGLEVTWLGLWTSLLFLVCFALSRKQRWRPHLAVAAGVLLGLLYLTEYVWIAAFLPVVIYVYFSTERHRRWQMVALVAIATAVVIAPWCVRNVRVVGHPFFSFRWAESVMATRSHPGNTLYRQFTTEVPSFLGYAIDRPMEIIQKVRDGLGVMYLALIRVAGPYVTPFFLVAILVTLGSATFERLRLLWYAVFAVMLVTLLFTMPSDRLLVPLGPVAGVIAAGFFFRLLETKVVDLPPKTRMRFLGLGVGTLMAFHALPLVVSLFEGLTPEETRTIEGARAAREVASLTDGPIVTNVPWLIAWYADREAIWLPKTRADLKNMQDKLGKLQWLVLTPMVASEEYDLAERTKTEWGSLWQRAMFEDVQSEGYRVDKRIAQVNWVLLRAAPVTSAETAPATTTGGGAAEQREGAVGEEPTEEETTQ